MRSTRHSQPAERIAAAAASRTTQRRSAAGHIAATPRVAAQRKTLDAAFGGAIQRQGPDEDLLQGRFATVQRAEEELLQGKFATVQRVEEEEMLQGRFLPVQRVEEEELLQGKFDTVQRRGSEDTERPGPNQTGMPDQLKAGIESLSGMSMDNVRVHLGSSQPAQLNALAYAQGTDIHVAPGQERHLPHEAWHVVQQAQGRVKPTMQLKDGVPVNDDSGLEHEADVMGTKALQAFR